MEKGTSQFCRSAGRCGAMRHGVHAGMPMGGPLPASLGEITSFSKKPSFLGNHSKYVGKHAAKAKAKAPWARSSQGQGMLACMQPRPRPWQPPWACSSQGQGTQPRPWHACVGTLACPWGHAAKAAPLACTLTEGQWQHGEGVACPVLGMPRPWHALGTPRRPWQHLGGGAAAKPR